MGPFGTIPQEHGHSRKGAKSDHIIQLNCRKVHNHAGYKKTEHEKQLRNKNDKLWLVTNISKCFGNVSKSIIRNNLDLYKRSEIYLI